MPLLMQFHFRIDQPARLREGRSIKINQRVPVIENCFVKTNP